MNVVASLPGKSHPLGATVMHGGVNFSIYSKNSTCCELLLFDDVNDSRPAKVFKLDREQNRTFHYWHIFVPGINQGQVYAYRLHGPYNPTHGLLFNAENVLLDPYGRGVVVPDNYDRRGIAEAGLDTSISMKSVVLDRRGYDWEGDKPLNHPFSKTIIYEMHVAGFTRHPSSGLTQELRGTYRGLIEKIPYLKDLGVTAVELLPVFQFDEQDAPPGLTNYWGYSPVSFFAPHYGYSSRNDPLSAVFEFREMVKALHRADIEIILDVVYNHTTENDETGPILCFKGLENRAYYILEQNGAKYANYSGTGNTLNTNHSVVRRLILDSLRYWVEEMHVDGFRFDLASILSRDESGVPLASPPILWTIDTEPVLAGTKLIAEAWDAAGLYQVGTFIGDHWKEWNGQFRDDVRKFVKGDYGTVKNVAARFLASPDLYGHESREPEQSINFVTCHDGFTLNDLVSYNEKHNHRNKEYNKDGHDYNFSWNCGVEGPTENDDVELLRKKQIKNFLTINLIALGVPMVLMGDEVRRTQLGNNNAYCQDNEISWFDWNLVEENVEFHRFMKQLIEFRLGLEIFQEGRGLTLSELLHLARIRWHGVQLNSPDWGYHSHSLAFSVRGSKEFFYIAMNAYWEALEFELLPLPQPFTSGWRRIIDTSLETPNDIVRRTNAPIVGSVTYKLNSRSTLVLMAESTI